MADGPSGDALTFRAFAAAIAADPRFAPADAGVCRAMLGFYAGQSRAMRLLGDQGQMRVLVACHYLDPDISTAAVQRLVPPTIAPDGPFLPTAPAMAGGRAWLSRFLAIGASVLDGSFTQLAANGRAERRAAAAAASPLAARAGGANMGVVKGRP